MKNPFPRIFLFSLLLIPAVSQTVLAAATPATTGNTGNPQPNAVIADVNGNKLTIADFQAYIKMRMSKEKNPGKLDQAQRQRIFSEYINRELLYQEAVKSGLDKNAMVKAEIENQRRNIVVSYTLKQLMNKPLKQSDMQAVYEREMASPGQEYKTRHILVKTEQQAKQLILQLDNGKNFMQLAMKHSIDASAKKGGELGWFSSDQMVEPYSDAARKLSNGSYTRTPVQTRFGWHIIRLDGTREIPAPSFDEVKNKIVALINNRRISAYIESLRKKASVTVANKPQSKSGDATNTASAH